jgi:hypothetical protein
MASKHARSNLAPVGDCEPSLRLPLRYNPTVQLCPQFHQLCGDGDTLMSPASMPTPKSLEALASLQFA